MGQVPIFPPAPRQATRAIPPAPQLVAEMWNTERKVPAPRAYETANYWTLPPVQQAQAAMLVLPDDISKYEDVQLRWESITINHVNTKTWSDNASKVQYIENLLEETEKRLSQQGRTTYPT